MNVEWQKINIHVEHTVPEPDVPQRNELAHAYCHPNKVLVGIKDRQL